jgi:hypothetical protein
MESFRKARGKEVFLSFPRLRKERERGGPSRLSQAALRGAKERLEGLMDDRVELTEFEGCLLQAAVLVVLLMAYLLVTRATAWVGE